MVEIASESKTKELIEMQFLNEEKKREFRDEVWRVNLDILMDYNSYFHQHNPKNIREEYVRAQTKNYNQDDPDSDNSGSVNSNPSTVFKDQQYSVLFTHKTLARLLQ